MHYNLKMDQATAISISFRSALMAAVCVPVLLSAVILFFQKTNHKACLFFALFLLMAVIKVIPQIIGFANFYRVWPGLTFAPFSVELLLGPLLLIHTHYLVFDHFNAKHKWLLVPGLIQIAYYSCAFVLLGDYKNKWAFNASFHEPFIVPLEAILGVTVFVYCWWHVFILNREYETYLEHNESAAQDFKPVWINRLLWSSLVLLVIFIILQLVPIFVTKISYIEAFPMIVLIMGILAWVGVEALRKLNTPFPTVKTNLNKPAKQPQTNQLAERDNWQNKAQELAHQMHENQWYLSPNLSLRVLAKYLGTNETYVSKTINNGLGVSFNHYINSLRVAKAKTLLLQPDASILNCALNSGFNSKATFNRVFKQQLGITPSQYINSN